MTTKKISRPPKSVYYAFRLRGKMRDLLILTAKENERSLSEEIERRLEQSFEIEQTDERIERLLGESKQNEPKLGNVH